MMGKKERKHFLLLAGFVFLYLLVWGCILWNGISAVKRANAANIQQGIAKEIVRFHVLANSDSEEDQALKLEVKTQVVEYCKELLADAETVQQTKEKLQENLENIQKTAKAVITEQGYSYPVEVRLENCYFPMKSYGDCTFPAGNYDALRVCIGEAEGKNWWCVLYPNLCFVDCVHAVVPEKEKQELQHVLTEEEYDSLFDWQEDTYRIKSGFLEMFDNWF